MDAMDLEILATPGLGDTTYLVGSDGEALLVDPQRDAWRFLEVARRREWRITGILETHVHNDYLSGALEARAATGATIVAPARGGYAFEHRGVDEGDIVEVGGLRLTALATPGHTPEHLAWLVAAADAPDGPAGTDAPPIAVFTGGSLLVGTAGRTDLLGPGPTPGLTADQQASLRRLGALPPGVRVLPTHGAGSFCNAGPASDERTSTIGRELTANPILRVASGDPAAFSAALMSGLGRFPAYYAEMAPINRRGPRVLGGVPLPPALSPISVAAATEIGVTVVDARDRVAFAAGHLPGALNIELDGTFAGYVGWLVPFDAPIVLVLPEPPEDALAEAVTQLLRVGYERVTGWLRGGTAAWAADGRPISSYPTVRIAEAVATTAAGGTLLDVRQPVEWRDDGVVPGSRTIFVADLPGRLDELPRGAPVTVICRSGARSAIAASVLDAAGFEVRLVTDGGVPDWPAPLVRGPVPGA